MIDTSTEQPVKVKYVEGAGPYLEIPYSQIPDLQRVLNEHGVKHWVEESVFSWNGGPGIVHVRFGRAGNRDAVQAVLDTVVSSGAPHAVVE